MRTIERPVPPARHRTLRRPRLVALSCAAVMMLAAGGCGSTSGTATAANTEPSTATRSPGTDPDPPYTLRLGFISTNKNLNGPEGFASEKGKLAEVLKSYGVEKIELSAFPNGPPLNEAITGGSIDVGIYGDTPALVGKASGLPTRLINQSTLDLDAYIVTKQGGPASVADLEGKSVGVQKGSYIHRYLLGVLEQKGLAGKVNVTSLATTDADAALERGELDAYAAPIPIAYVLAAKGYPVIDQARRDHPDLVGSSVTAGTQAFLDAHPSFLTAWDKARQESLALVKADPKGFLQFQATAQNLPVDKLGGIDKLAEAYPLDSYPTEPLPARGKALLEGTKAFLLDQQLIKEDVSIDQWYLSR